MQPIEQKKAQRTLQLISYLKKHYEHICKLCALSDIPYLPSIKNPTESNSRLTTQAKSLESALDHIKTQIRHVTATSGKGAPLTTQIIHHPELCESLSNYRRDLESLFQQLQSIHRNQHK